MKIEQWLLLAALALFLWLSYGLIAPYLNAIVVAAIVSMLAQSLYERLLQLVKGRKNLAATLASLLILLLVLIPIILAVLAVLAKGAQYANEAVIWVKSGGIDTFISQNTWVQQGLATLKQHLPEDMVDVNALPKRLMAVGSMLASNAMDISGRLLSDTTSVLVSLGIMLFVMFFLLRDQQEIVHRLRHALPLSRSQEDHLFAEVRQVSRSAILGSFLTAIAQGVAGGIGLWIAGLDGLFWGTMMAFASLIPIVGTALIWIPSALYLALTGDSGMAVFLAIWSAVVVGSIDNFLRPVFMQGGNGMSTLMMFLAIIGGLQVYGLLGLVYGPLIFALTIVLYRIYEIEFADFLAKQDRS